MELHSDDFVQEIDRLVAVRSSLKQQCKWAEADEIQEKLWHEPYCVKLYDEKTNGSIFTQWQPRKLKKDRPPPSVVWVQLAKNNAVPTDETIETTGGSAPSSPIPFVLGTVDNPHYRARYNETIEHLQQWQARCSCSRRCGPSPPCGSTTCSRMACEPCYLLNLDDCPSIGVKKILFEGWRQKLVPQLFKRYSGNHQVIMTNFLLVAEDDIRIPADMNPCMLVDICRTAFRSHPDLDMLSLGHSWKALSNRKKNQDDSTTPLNLFQFLREGKGAGVHASTLFAIRLPDGLVRLRHALEAAAEKKKQTHLDQFLFYSPHHDLKIALSDPPLVGWGEVELTLTKSVTGHRRRGGGRLGLLPPNAPTNTDDISWVQRKLVETRVAWKADDLIG